jgi:hypothetical protein
MEKRVKARKEAFDFIMRVALRASTFNGGINSLDKLASVLDVPIEHLTDLRKGKADPSEKLVSRFKDMFLTENDAIWPKGDFNEYLVKPFE